MALLPVHPFNQPTCFMSNPILYIPASDHPAEAALGYDLMVCWICLLMLRFVGEGSEEVKGRKEVGLSAQQK